MNLAVSCRLFVEPEPAVGLAPARGLACSREIRAWLIEAVRMDACFSGLRDQAVIRTIWPSVPVLVGFGQSMLNPVCLTDRVDAHPPWVRGAPVPRLPSAWTAYRLNYAAPASDYPGLPAQRGERSLRSLGARPSDRSLARTHWCNFDCLRGRGAFGTNSSRGTSSHSLETITRSNPVSMPLGSITPLGGCVEPG